jgi:tetratricopeptide (TPR) repeat protein
MNYGISAGVLAALLLVLPIEAEDSDFRNQRYSDEDAMRRNEALLEKGAAYARSGEYGNALRILREADVALPNDGLTWYSICRVYVSMGEVELARMAALHMLECKFPEDNQKFMFAAQGLLRIGAADEALQLMELGMAIQKIRGDWWGYSRLLRVRADEMRKKDDVRGAIALLDEALDSPMSLGIGKERLELLTRMRSELQTSLESEEGP